MRYLIDSKGQAPVGILLMLVAVILIATIIGIYLKGKAKEQANKADADLDTLLDKTGGSI